jgi:hypothetical protein
VQQSPLVVRHAFSLLDFPARGNRFVACVGDDDAAQLVRREVTWGKNTPEFNAHFGIQCIARFGRAAQWKAPVGRGSLAIN